MKIDAEKRCRKKIAVIISSMVIGAVLIICGLMYGIYALCLDPYRGTDDPLKATKELDAIMTGEQAEEDINFVYDMLRSRHPAWLDGSEELCQRVRAQYEAEMSSIGESMTVLEVWQACGRIVATMKDGHSYVIDNGIGLYINDLTDILASNRLIAVNGEPCGDIFERFCSVYPEENREYSLSVFTSEVLIDREYLAWCGVDVSDGVAFTFENESGESFERHYVFVAAEEIIGIEAGQKTPVSSSWIDEENAVAVFDLNRCVYDDAYISAVADFFDDVIESGCSTVVVDLRGNGGGDSRVADEFLRYIDVDSYKTWGNKVRFGNHLWVNKNGVVQNKKADVTFEGELFVMMDVYTYSSAMEFAMLVGDNDLGTLVGEPSGNYPDGYGDCLYFSLPNSGLKLSVSFKKWVRVDQSKCGQAVEPDIFCDPDDAYERVLDMIGDKGDI